jgi:hypothetical protein
VPTGMVESNTELPLIDAGDSALVNEKIIELPGCTSYTELLATNWMA